MLKLKQETYSENYHNFLVLLLSIFFSFTSPHSLVVLFSCWSFNQISSFQILSQNTNKKESVSKFSLASSHKLFSIHQSFPLNASMFQGFWDCTVNWESLFPSIMPPCPLPFSRISSYASKTQLALFLLTLSAGSNFLQMLVFCISQGRHKFLLSSQLHCAKLSTVTSQAQQGASLSAAPGTHVPRNVTRSTGEMQTNKRNSYWTAQCLFKKKKK